MENIRIKDNVRLRQLIRLRLKELVEEKTKATNIERDLKEKLIKLQSQKLKIEGAIIALSQVLNYKEENK